jgi:hypothetical protein
MHHLGGMQLYGRERYSPVAVLGADVFGTERVSGGFVMVLADHMWS